MSTSTGDFEKMEEISAINFKDCIQQTKARQVIYLSGIVNEEILSKHLTSRKNVERILGSGSYSLTTLRAGIIIGSGSASFEIITRPGREITCDDCSPMAEYTYHSLLQYVMLLNSFSVYYLMKRHSTIVTISGDLIL